MRIIDLLKPEAIELGISVASKAEAIDKIVSGVKTKLSVDKATDAISAVKKLF